MKTKDTEGHETMFLSLRNHCEAIVDQYREATRFFEARRYEEAVARCTEALELLRTPSPVTEPERDDAITARRLQVFQFDCTHLLAECQVKLHQTGKGLYYYSQAVALISKDMPPQLQHKVFFDAGSLALEAAVKMDEPGTWLFRYAKLCFESCLHLGCGSALHLLGPLLRVYIELGDMVAAYRATQMILQLTRFGQEGITGSALDKIAWLSATLEATWNPLVCLSPSSTTKRSVLSRNVNPTESDIGSQPQLIQPSSSVSDAVFETSFHSATERRRKRIARLLADSSSSGQKPPALEPTSAAVTLGIPVCALERLVELATSPGNAAGSEDKSLLLCAMQKLWKALETVLFPSESLGPDLLFDNVCCETLFKIPVLENCPSMCPEPKLWIDWVDRVCNRDMPKNCAEVSGTSDDSETETRPDSYTPAAVSVGRGPPGSPCTSKSTVPTHPERLMRSRSIVTDPSSNIFGGIETQTSATSSWRPRGRLAKHPRYFPLALCESSKFVTALYQLNRLLQPFCAGQALSEDDWRLRNAIDVLIKFFPNIDSNENNASSTCFLRSASSGLHPLNIGSSKCCKKGKEIGPLVHATQGCATLGEVFLKLLHSSVTIESSITDIRTFCFLARVLYTGRPQHPPNLHALGDFEVILAVASRLHPTEGFSYLKWTTEWLSQKAAFFQDPCSRLQANWLLSHTLLIGLDGGSQSVPRPKQNALTLDPDQVLPRLQVLEAVDVLLAQCLQCWDTSAEIKIEGPSIAAIRRVMDGVQRERKLLKLSVVVEEIYFALKKATSARPSAVNATSTSPEETARWINWIEQLNGITATILRAVLQQRIANDSADAVYQPPAFCRPFVERLSDCFQRLCDLIVPWFASRRLATEKCAITSFLIDMVREPQCISPLPTCHHIPASTVSRSENIFTLTTTEARLVRTFFEACGTFLGLQACFAPDLAQVEETGTSTGTLATAPASSVGGSGSVRKAATSRSAGTPSTANGPVPATSLGPRNPEAVRHYAAASARLGFPINDTGTAILASLTVLLSCVSDIAVVEDTEMEELTAQPPPSILLGIRLRRIVAAPLVNVEDALGIEGFPTQVEESSCSSSTESDEQEDLSSPFAREDSERSTASLSAMHLLRQGQQSIRRRLDILESRVFRFQPEINCLMAGLITLILADVNACCYMARFASFPSGGSGGFNSVSTKTQMVLSRLRFALQAFCQVLVAPLALTSRSSHKRYQVTPALGLTDEELPQVQFPNVLLAWDLTLPIPAPGEPPSSEPYADTAPLDSAVYLTKLVTFMRAILEAEVSVYTPLNPLAAAYSGATLDGKSGCAGAGNKPLVAKPQPRGRQNCVPRWLCPVGLDTCFVTPDLHKLPTWLIQYIKEAALDDQDTWKWRRGFLSLMPGFTTLSLPCYVLNATLRFTAVKFLNAWKWDVLRYLRSLVPGLKQLGAIKNASGAELDKAFLVSLQDAIPRQVWDAIMDAVTPGIINPFALPIDFRRDPGLRAKHRDLSWDTEMILAELVGIPLLRLFGLPLYPRSGPPFDTCRPLTSEDFDALTAVVRETSQKPNSSASLPPTPFYTFSPVSLLLIARLHVKLGEWYYSATRLQRRPPTGKAFRSFLAEAVEASLFVDVEADDEGEKEPGSESHDTSTLENEARRQSTCISGTGDCLRRNTHLQPLFSCSSLPLQWRMHQFGLWTCLSDPLILTPILEKLDSELDSRHEHSLHTASYEVKTSRGGSKRLYFPSWPHPLLRTYGERSLSRILESYCHLQEIGCRTAEKPLICTGGKTVLDVDGEALLWSPEEGGRKPDYDILPNVEALDTTAIYQYRDGRAEVAPDNTAIRVQASICIKPLSTAVPQFQSHWNLLTDFVVYKVQIAELLNDSFYRFCVPASETSAVQFFQRLEEAAFGAFENCLHNRLALVYPTRLRRICYDDILWGDRSSLYIKDRSLTPYVAAYQTANFETNVSDPWSASLSAPLEAEVTGDAAALFQKYCAVTTAQYPSTVNSSGMIYSVGALQLEDLINNLASANRAAALGGLGLAIEDAWDQVASPLLLTDQESESTSPLYTHSDQSNLGGFRRWPRFSCFTSVADVRMREGILALFLLQMERHIWKVALDNKRTGQTVTRDLSSKPASVSMIESLSDSEETSSTRQSKKTTERTIIQRLASTLPTSLFNTIELYAFFVRSGAELLLAQFKMAKSLKPLSPGAFLLALLQTLPENILHQSFVFEIPSFSESEKEMHARRIAGCLKTAVTLQEDIDYYCQRLAPSAEENLTLFSHSLRFPAAHQLLTSSLWIPDCIAAQCYAARAKLLLTGWGETLVELQHKANDLVSLILFMFRALILFSTSFHKILRMQKVFLNSKCTRPLGSTQSHAPFVFQKDIGYCFLIPAIRREKLRLNLQLISQVFSWKPLRSCSALLVRLFPAETPATLHDAERRLVCLNRVCSESEQQWNQASPSAGSAEFFLESLLANLQGCIEPTCLSSVDTSVDLYSSMTEVHQRHQSSLVLPLVRYYLLTQNVESAWKLLSPLLAKGTGTVARLDERSVLNLSPTGTSNLGSSHGSSKRGGSAMVTSACLLYQQSLEMGARKEQRLRYSIVLSAIITLYACVTSLVRQSLLPKKSISNITVSEKENLEDAVLATSEKSTSASPLVIHKDNPYFWGRVVQFLDTHTAQRSNFTFQLKRHPFLKTEREDLNLLSQILGFLTTSLQNHARALKKLQQYHLSSQTPTASQSSLTAALRCLGTGGETIAPLLHYRIVHSLQTAIHMALIVLLQGATPPFPFSLGIATHTNSEYNLGSAADKSAPLPSLPTNLEKKAMSWTPPPLDLRVVKQFVSFLSSISDSQKKKFTRSLVHLAHLTYFFEPTLPAELSKASPTHHRSLAQLLPTSSHTTQLCIQFNVADSRTTTTATAATESGPLTESGHESSLRPPTDRLCTIPPHLAASALVEIFPPGETSLQRANPYRVALKLQQQPSTTVLSTAALTILTAETKSKAFLRDTWEPLALLFHHGTTEENIQSFVRVVLKDPSGNTSNTPPNKKSQETLRHKRASAAQESSSGSHHGAPHKEGHKSNTSNNSKTS